MHKLLKAYWLLLLCAQLQLGNFSLQCITFTAELVIFAPQLFVGEFMQRFERFYLGLCLLLPLDFLRLCAALSVSVALSELRRVLVTQLLCVLAEPLQFFALVCSSFQLHLTLV